MRSANITFFKLKPYLSHSDFPLVSYCDGMTT